MIVIRMDRRVLIGFLAVVIILLALGVGIFVGSLSGRGSQTAAVQAPVQQAPVQQVPVQPQAPAAQQPQAQPSSNVPLITVDEARPLFGQPNTVFVDSRVQTEWQRQRIKGAISMPHTEVAQRLSELPKDKDLIIYCA